MRSALISFPTRNRPYPVVPTAWISSRVTPASSSAVAITSRALFSTSVVGCQPVPMILLSFMTTAFVVAEPESTPSVIPAWTSRASSARRRAMVVRASILVRRVPAVVRSVNE